MKSIFHYAMKSWLLTWVRQPSSSKPMVMRFAQPTLTSWRQIKLVTCWTSLTGTRALTNARDEVWGTTWLVPDSGSLPARRADERESEDEGEDDGHLAARFPIGGEGARPPVRMPVPS
jgi:hypothetical protein